MKKSFFFILGIISLVLALLGVFLPLLPTTPFALLSIYCFERSSKRFHDMCLRLPIIGEAVKNWKKDRIISLRTKWIATALLVTSSLVMFIFSSLIIYVKMALIFFLCLINIFILSQKSS